MTVNTFPRQYIEDALDDAGIYPETEESAIHEDYSGRFMYGDKCDGVVADTLRLFRFFTALGVKVAEVAENDQYDYETKLYDFVSAARTDSMGTETIVYFPGWKFTEE